MFCSWMHSTIISFHPHKQPCPGAICCACSNTKKLRFRKRSLPAGSDWTSSGRAHLSDVSCGGFELERIRKTSRSPRKKWRMCRMAFGGPRILATEGSPRGTARLGKGPPKPAGIGWAAFPDRTERAAGPRFTMAMAFMT